MRTKTIVKPAIKLTPGERKKCYSLSLRRDGMMLDDLDRYVYHRDEDARAILIQDSAGSLIGWALVGSNYLDGKYGASFYVRASERNKGYGSRLMYHALKVSSPLKVIPYSNPSAAFFRKHKDNLIYKGWK